MNMGSSLGPVLVHLTGLLLAELWPFSFAKWRVLVLVPALLTAIFAWTRRGLLESPYYLYSKGSLDYAVVVNQIAKKNGTEDFVWTMHSHLSDPLINHEEKTARNGHIFDQKHMGLTIPLLLAQVLSSFSAASVMVFLTLYYSYEVSTDLYVILITMQVSGIATIALSKCLVDSRLGRKGTYGLFYLLAGGLFLLFAFTNRFWALVLLAGLYNGCTQSASAAKNLIAPESFEPDIRGQGIGLIAASARAAGILSPLVTGLVQSQFGGSVCVVFISGSFVLTALAVLLLKETRVPFTGHLNS